MKVLCCFFKYLVCELLVRFVGSFRNLVYGSGHGRLPHGGVYKKKDCFLGVFDGDIPCIAHGLCTPKGFFS